MFLTEKEKGILAKWHGITKWYMSAVLLSTDMNGETLERVAEGERSEEFLSRLRYGDLPNVKKVLQE